ncbi:ADP-L-glycero-D-manno-heptose-6-epimerase [Candidatus Campbellbacteria bacterium CG22_combo_CG10-13_8_21_14_all_36_13]|uniref:ADP-L-glycero-D-manno-heptose-6-epimerase n=1 Tax=Candidatus Campbellbacteria bacterium CG22_combo_CG10-13_8_21_14_all_36_13 TaxID=1974529 RepID=A0A2H0E0E6_9BACT|nr:MAG: ADP-L-glycero-D-manno-heptose-6-epimerase [Candidatus Campbellbacteria bacterium CG22_combo_CG10-13_8_21_14_all_36_13]
MNENQNKKILVTGGAGFIGSNLVEALVKDPNNRVVSLDNYSTGLKENHIEGAEYIEGHTKDIETLIDFVPDMIYHLGEYARTSASFDDVDTVWDFNVFGTFKVLEFCRKNNVRLLYAGSSTKFGDRGEGKDQSPYAWSKSRNTDLVVQYGEWFGLDYVITYFYNVYGPRERSGRLGSLIEILKEKYKNGEPLPIVSPGTQKRNFTYVGDIVRGLILVGEKGKGDGYALGNEESYTILEVAKMFGDNIEMLPERKGDRAVSTLDLSRTAGELGWKAEKKLAEYIESIKS